MGTIVDLARENRKQPTEAESIMWQILRGQFYGFRFRRQHPIAGYITDFACLKKKLIIEIDGGYHSTQEQQEWDEARTNILHGRGFTVLRFTNEEVQCDTDNVTNKISNYIIKELNDEEQK